MRRQRIGLPVALLILLFMIWGIQLSRRAPLAASSQSPGALIITGSPQHHYPNVDLSSPRAPFIAWPLARICTETTAWVPGLVFLCDNNSGGPGNIRNYILTCVRYAVEAGATSLVLPRIRVRSADHLADLFRGGHAPFGYMFSETRFREGLAAACPRVAVYAALEDVPYVLQKVAREGLPDVEKMVERVAPKDLGRRAGCDLRDQNRHTDRFGDRFRAWLDESALERRLPAVGIESPRLIRLQWGVLWDWEVMRDGPEFVATFGGLLMFRDNVLNLAHAVVRAMRREAGRISNNAGQANESFLAIHLRSEEDALKEWPTYEVQAAGFVTEVGRRGFKGGVAYLASGSESESQKFADEAWSEMQLNVRTKYDMLHGQKLETLKSMTWDQQALVDFAVLLESDYFVGVSPSSFSINVALKRHLQIGGLLARPWKVGGTGDGRSWVVGNFENYWDDWLFMYDGMWP
ncbi:hypothetical protein JX266_000298 [Neoarthrinium moseri]|nr:hypothetical protein JX266_000298 [Neoarthrinium moseri]